MKTVLKIGLLFLLVGGLSACQEDDQSTAPQEPEETRYVYLYFNMELMEPSESEELENSHYYISEGYTVSFSGGVSEAYETIYNVDLNEALKFEANSDVVVSITHPEYKDIEITTGAFYGLDQQSLSAGSVDEFTLDMNLLQGYITVTTDEQFDLGKYNLRVNQEVSSFNEMYYVTSSIVESEISNEGLSTTKKDTNIIGDGLVYTAYEDENGNLVFM